MLALLVTLLACTPPDDSPEKKPDPVDTDPAQTDSGPSTPTDTSTDTHTGTTDTATGVDCSVLPPTPAPFKTTNGWPTAEDFDFDAEGYFVAVNGGNLVGRNQAGEMKVIAANLGIGTAGTRILPTGDWVINDTGNGALVRIDVTTGAKITVASGFSYPNGLEVGSDGYAFIGEQSGGRIIQVDPYTGDKWVVASGLSSPNGVILSVDEQTIYAGSFGGGNLYAVDRLGPTEWDTPRVVRDSWPGKVAGSFDGINVDSCGNIYLTDYGGGYVVRVTPDGSQVHGVADPPSGWIPNMRWGNGHGGWDPNTLYVTDISSGEVFALEIGIPGKPHVLAAP